MKKTADPSPPPFEQSLSELEALVAALEQGEMTLEQSLSAFERGVTLTRVCRAALDAAEQRVRILTDGRQDGEPAPFTPEKGSVSD